MESAQRNAQQREARLRQLDAQIAQLNAARAERQRLRHAQRREAMQMERARQIHIAQLEAAGQPPEFAEYDEDAALEQALQASVASETARLNTVDTVNETETSGLDEADDGELVRDFMGITGVLAADEARRYLALSDGNLEIAVRVFEDAFQIDESAPPALPASPSASDMAVDSPARMIDLTQDSPVTRITGNYADLTDDVFHGATEDDDDDDASLAAAIAMSLFTDDAAAGPPPPLARTVSVRAKSELTELMEQQDRDFQAALSKDRERAAATASTASTASTTNVTPTTTTKEASTASTTNVTPTTATKEAEVVDKDALLAVPAEPVAGTAGVVTVRFTLPGGTRVARRFLPQTSVAELRAAVRQEMLHDKVPSFEFMIPMSKTTFGDATQTLAALGLTGGVAITVIEK